ncbi:uncharacterized protein LOC143024764 [Oratosquilla oratoria]|uniref:uncharacterized protein LOC143024764 n=1 Tax=Oratosquilla oratoria TaxID=337810 RepID=UPI003F75ABAD
MSSSVPLVHIDLHSAGAFPHSGNHYRHRVPSTSMAPLSRSRRDTSAASLQYTSSFTRLLRPYRSVSSSLYLTVATPSGTNTPVLSLSHLQGSGQEGCFQLHMYNTLNSTQGLLVTIQAPNSSHFISTSDGTLSLTVAPSSETPSSVQTIDSRFFYIQSAEGDDRVTIKSALTEHYLSSSGSTLSLVSRPTGTDAAQLFEILTVPS